MPERPGYYPRHRYPAEIISHALWLYHRFALSLRDVEELLFGCGVVDTYGTVRARVEKFGKCFATELRRREKHDGAEQARERNREGPLFGSRFLRTCQFANL